MSIGSTNFGAQIGIGASFSEASSSAPSAPPTTQSPDNEPEDPIYVDDLLQLLRAEPSTNQALGVYTHSSGEHYIIWLQGGKIYSIKPVMTEPGLNLQSTYIEENPIPSSRATTVGGSDAQCKFEAYVLGQIESLEPRVEIGEYMVEGSAFHYGWMFNWGGSQATLVTQKPNQDYAGTLLSWTARTYTLSVSEDINGVLSASVSSGSSVEWEPQIGKPNIWLPIFSKGGMRLWYPYACGTGPGGDYGEGTWKAPMFAFYKADGSLKTIYHESEPLPVYSIGDLEDQAREQHCACLGWRHSYGENESEFIGRISGYHHGFTTSDGEDYRGYEAPGGLYHWKRILVEGPSEYEENQLPSLNGYTVERWTDIAQNYVVGTGRDSFNNFRYEVNGGHVLFEEIYTGQKSSVSAYYTEHCVPALLFPFHGSESAFIAKYQNTYRRATSQGLGRTAITETKQWDITEANGPLSDWQNVLFPIPSTDCGTLPDEDVCIGNSTLTAPAAGSSFPWLGIIPGESYNSVDIEVFTEIELHLITPFETLDLDSLSEVTDGVASPELGQFYQVFFPAACDVSGPPTIPKYDNLQSSFGNAIYTESGFDMSLGSNNSVAPPAIIQDSLWVGRV